MVAAMMGPPTSPRRKGSICSKPKHTTAFAYTERAVFDSIYTSDVFFFPLCL